MLNEQNIRHPVGLQKGWSYAMIRKNQMELCLCSSWKRRERRRCTKEEQLLLLGEERKKEKAFYHQLVLRAELQQPLSSTKKQDKDIILSHPAHPKPSLRFYLQDLQADKLNTSQKSLRQKAKFSQWCTMLGTPVWHYLHIINIIMN